MKKIYWILIIIFLVLVTAVLVIFIWSNNKAKNLAKQRENLVEIPAGTNYQNLTDDQLNTLLKQIVAKYPNQVLKNKLGQIFTLIQEIVFTQNNQPVNNFNLTPTPNNALKIDPADLPTDIPPANRKIHWPTFVFISSGDTDDSRAQAEQEIPKIRDSVEKYYPVLVKLMGEPFDVENRQINIICNKDRAFLTFLPQPDTIITYSSSPWAIVPLLSASFYGAYYNRLLQTWKYGLIYATADLAIRQFPEDRDPLAEYIIQTLQSDLEKYNVVNFPIWGANIFFENDILGTDGPGYRMLLAAGVLKKPYQYDKEFYQKLNERFFQIPLNSTDWQDERKIFSRISAGAIAIEGNDINTWYNKQHILHQVQTNPLVILLWCVIGQHFYTQNSLPGYIMVYSFKSTSVDNGAKFIARTNVPHKIIIKDDAGNVVKPEQEYKTNNVGKIEITLESVGIPQTGRYQVIRKVTSEEVQTNFVAFRGISQPSSLFGGIINFGSGKIILYQNQEKIQETTITHGAFIIDKATQGVYKIEVQNISGQKVAEKELAKDWGKYFTLIESATPSYPAAPPTGSRGSTETVCQNLTVDSTWKTYSNGENSFSIKYPAKWGYQKQEIGASGVGWVVDFGLKNQAKVIWVGIGPGDDDVLKKILSSETKPGFDFESEEPATIESQSRTGTKFVVQGRSMSYKSYIYQFPYFNLGYIFQGPAEEDASQFENCEPTIFQLMLETFQFPAENPNQMPSM